MSVPLDAVRPNVGARVLKTGLAVFTALVLTQAVDPRYAVYAGLAAFLAVQPSVGRSRATIQQQVIGNGIGAAMAVLMAYTLGHGPLAFATGVVALVVVLRQLNLPDSINLAVVMFLFALERPEGDFLGYGLHRVGAVFFGTVVGYAINRFVYPPDYRRQFHQHLLTAGARVDAFLGEVRRHLAEPEALPKAAIKAAAAAVQGELDLSRHFLRLAEEDGSAGGETLHKAINSIGVFTERLMDIHKVLLRAGAMDPAALTAVDSALAALLAARRAAYARFGAGGGRPGPRDPGALDRVGAALGALAELVSARVATPAGRPSGLPLHSVLTNLEHMSWRLESLERFLDGEEKGAPPGT